MSKVHFEKFDSHDDPPIEIGQALALTVCYPLRWETDEETRAQESDMTCPGSHGQQAMEV